MYDVTSLNTMIFKTTTVRTLTLSTLTMTAIVSITSYSVTPTQLVARGQRVVRDTVLCCLRRQFKWEKVFKLLRVKAEVESGRNYL